MPKEPNIWIHLMPPLASAKYGGEMCIAPGISPPPKRQPEAWNIGIVADHYERLRTDWHIAPCKVRVAV
jgi:hypothetical protein